MTKLIEIFVKKSSSRNFEQLLLKNILHKIKFKIIMQKYFTLFLASSWTRALQ